MTALVLSAGGMYGAYQAGAWKALAGVFRPDLVVGASIGALTGWAIAGGCHPDELIDRWLHLEAAERFRWKFPRSPIHGVLDTTPLQITSRMFAFPPRERGLKEPAGRFHGGAQPFPIGFFLRRELRKPFRRSWNQRKIRRSASGTFISREEDQEI